MPVSREASQINIANNTFYVPSSSAPFSHPHRLNNGVILIDLPFKIVFVSCLQIDLPSNFYNCFHYGRFLVNVVTRSTHINETGTWDSLESRMKCFVCTVKETIFLCQTVLTVQLHVSQRSMREDGMRVPSCFYTVGRF